MIVLLIRIMMMHVLVVMPLRRIIIIQRVMPVVQHIEEGTNAEKEHVRERREDLEARKSVVELEGLWLLAAYVSIQRESEPSDKKRLEDTPRDFVDVHHCHPE